jgi:hypothetical protein
MHSFTQPASEPWLNTHLFRLDEGWLGQVRLLSFLGNGHVTQSIPARVRFGDGIQLDAVEILDSVTVADGVVRIRLIWQAQQNIGRLFITCANLVDVVSDRVVAQHYGQPVGDQRPTDTWRRGDVVVDQFAIRVAAQTPPGNYQLRLGLYDMDTQGRLPVYTDDDSPAEAFFGGTITVR